MSGGVSVCDRCGERVATKFVDDDGWCIGCQQRDARLVTDGGRDVDEDPLEDLYVDEEDVDDLVSEAEEAREQFTSGKERLQNIKQRLREHVEELVEADAIPEDEAESVSKQIDRGEYGAARERIRELRETYELRFDDEDLETFAHQFGNSWTELVANVEEVRTAVLEIREMNQMSDEDLVSYLYGKHSGLNKGDIREVLDTFGDLEKTGVSPKEAARVLQAYNSNLRIEPTTRVLEYIKKESERE